MGAVLIAGCGYVGTALGERLAADGHTVVGLRRDPSRLPRAIQPWAADLSDPAALTPPCRFDVVYYTAGANGFSDAAYRAAYVDGFANVLGALQGAGQSPRRVFFTSSTGVYAQDDGGWVDEESPAAPVRFSGTRLLEGERLLHAGPFPGTVVRLGGIYGPGRTRLLESVRDGSARCVRGRPSILNLIHRDDCAGVLRHLMGLADPAPLYVAVDDAPSERSEILRWIAERLGVRTPPEVDAADAPEPQRGGNRRCSNARLRASGYTFQYPDFRAGYGSLIGAAVARGVG